MNTVAANTIHVGHVREITPATAFVLCLFVRTGLYVLHSKYIVMFIASSTM